ncbi:MAG: DUF2628 domain-containing protein [Xanthomonadales bacterium]|nr:DUF2628 domain-containing protein [Xanthomonadales bacterium]
MPDAFHIRDNGVVQGPYTKAQIRQLVQEGKLTPSMDLSADGVTWHAARSIKGLFPPAAPPKVPDFSDDEGLNANEGAQSQDPSVSSGVASEQSPPNADTIDKLSVSDAWKNTFREIQGSPAKSQFNILAFLFTFFYYAAKGMWKKGLALVLFGAIFSTLIEFAVGLAGITNLNGIVYAIPSSALCAILANRDYYSLKMKGEDFWPSLNWLGNPAALIAVALVAFSGMIFLSMRAEKMSYSCSHPEVLELVRQIISEVPFRANMLSQDQIDKQSKVLRGLLLMEFDGIRSMNSQNPGEKLCSAQIKITAKDPKAIPMFQNMQIGETLTYGVSFTDDGRLWVQVYD